MKKQEVVKKPNYKTEWDLTLFYKSINDPKIEADMKSIEKSCEDFSKKYSKKDFTSSPLVLKKVLDEYFDLPIQRISIKPTYYLQLVLHINSENKQAQAKLDNYSKRLTDASNMLTFFILKVAKIEKNKQSTFLNDQKLQPYKYYLECIFKSASHNLSEKEEQLFASVEQTSYAMWVNLQEELLNKKEVVYKKEKMPMSKVKNTIPELATQKERLALSSLFNSALKENADVAEAELNAIVTHKIFSDNMHGYKKPYSKTLVDYEQDEKTVENLASTVSKMFPISHDFYKLHKKLLGVDKFYFCDSLAEIGKIKKTFTFDESVKLAKEAFSEFGEDYPKLITKYLEEGRIDVFPKKGKLGGGYNWALHSSDEPLGVILLNHNDSIRSFEVLAHEMGHATHSNFSAKNQPRWYRDYSTAAAEVASTFFEQLSQDFAFQQLSKREQIIALHKKILNDIACIFRQIALFNFECEFHKLVGEQGRLNHTEIAQLLSKHMKSFLGPAVEMTDDDGYLFVIWAHIRFFFYTHTYAFGQLVSKSLYKKWREDKNYKTKIEKFLSAGGSDTVENIFKSIGIDVTKPEFFENGLNAIKEDINLLKKLTKNGTSF